MPRASSPPPPPAAATNHPHNPHLDVAVTCLWVLTPLTATLSLIIVCVAMTTNQWLHTEEKMTNPNYNGTGERDYLSKYTVSGLWTLCYTNLEPTGRLEELQLWHVADTWGRLAGEMDLHCFNIDYFPREEYSPDPNDSTMAIPYAVTKSALFFILATLFLFVGEFCCMFGHFARQRRIFTFVSGVVCIISGLLMLIGLVMYISIFKAEIGSKLRPRSQLQPPLFTYRYGFSFLLIVSGFMATEIAGTCAIFLYIYWHQKEWGRKRHEHHLHRRKLSASSMLLTVDHHNPTSLFPCRRHPHSYQQQYASGRPPQLLRASPQRRLYLDRDPRGPDGVECSNSGEPSPCRHPPLPSFTGSMRDMTSASYYSFPAPAGTVVDTSTGYHQHYYHHHHHGEEECEATPPPVDMHPHHHHPHHHHHHHPHHHGSARELSASRSSFFPRDATTNTVSTTADINSCGDNDVEDEDYSPSMQHEHEFVTFDLDDHPPMPPVRAVATTTDELSPQQRRKDFGFDTLRRTTPV